MSNTPKKIPQEDWFIQNYFYKSSIIIGKCAGVVGHAIYDYLKFRKQFDGDNFFTLPKQNFRSRHNISRQRQAEAIDKLEAEGLIKTIRKKGCSTKVRLLLK